MVPGSLTRRGTGPPSLSGLTQGLKSFGEPPQSGCQTDRQELPSCPILTLPPGETQMERFPQKPIQSTATLVPAPHHPSMHLFSQTSSLLLLSFQGASKPISDIHSAHMLTSDSFVKYQCICCPGDVPKTSCTIHTHHSLFLFVSFNFFFVFFCVCCKSFSIKKISFPSMILSSCCNRQPSERLSPKRGPGGTGFQYGAKRHALAGTHSRHSALGQFNQETGRETAFVFFLLLKLSPSLRCLVGACPALDVPLHVKSQMVRPGETSGDRGEGERKSITRQTWTIGVNVLAN